MSDCGLKEQDLMVWMDGEAGRDAARVEKHVHSCAACAQKMEAFEQSSLFLKQAVNASLDGVEPLRGLQQIRQRIEKAEHESLGHRLGAWFDDVWTLHRGALAGVGAAAVIVALSVPVVNTWMARGPVATTAPAPLIAAVTVESLEVAGDTKAVVYQPSAGMATLIWVDASDETL